MSPATSVKLLVFILFLSVCICVRALPGVTIPEGGRDPGDTCFKFTRFWGSLLGPLHSDRPPRHPRPPPSPAEPPVAFAQRERETSLDARDDDDDGGGGARRSAPKTLSARSALRSHSVLFKSKIT